MTGTLHPACIAPRDLLNECKESRDRASGPGGQHRNKVETRVTLTHCETGIEGCAGERRSQVQNRKKALFRLRLNLAIQVRCIPNSPSDLWKSRCQNGQIRCNAEHLDFPAILAEALDWIAVGSWRPAEAATALDCSSSQLIKLVKKCRPAFERVNNERAAAGLRALR
jgi:hypothetical protein